VTKRDPDIGFNRHRLPQPPPSTRDLTSRLGRPSRVRLRMSATETEYGMEWNGGVARVCVRVRELKLEDHDVAGRECHHPLIN